MLVVSMARETIVSYFLRASAQAATSRSHCDAATRATCKGYFYG
jgi:hypothetical protein